MISLACRSVLRKIPAAIVAAAFLIGVFAPAPSAGQDSDHNLDVQKEKKLAKGEKEAKRMLLLMDADKSGKVSKEEFMRFMEAEFERLDVNKDGELDVRELTESKVQIRTRGR